MVDGRRESQLQIRLNNLGVVFRLSTAPTRCSFIKEPSTRQRVGVISTQQSCDFLCSLRSHCSITELLGPYVPEVVGVGLVPARAPKGHAKRWVRISPPLKERGWGGVCNLLTGNLFFTFKPSNAVWLCVSARKLSFVMSTWFAGGHKIRPYDFGGELTLGQNTPNFQFSTFNLQFSI